MKNNQNAFALMAIRSSGLLYVGVFSILFSGLTASASVTQKVEYIVDSIAEKDGEYIRLLGGSSWILSYSSLALVTDDVIIVFHQIATRDNKASVVPVVYVDGEEIPARHVGGAYAKETGHLTTVVESLGDGALLRVESLGDGALLRLEDGTLLSIPEYDRYDTGWWLPPYKALVTGNGLYLWNLKKGKKVWVNPAR
ncbi:hypothetical protein MYX82_04510 [Acidobacteria bacterium AH-259-D05]|nr:hypothetical protein [Acidobacteria bacterium AH-259-D05]